MFIILFPVFENTLIKLLCVFKLWTVLRHQMYIIFDYILILKICFCFDRQEFESF